MVERLGGSPAICVLSFCGDYFIQYDMITLFPWESWGLFIVTDGRALCFPDFSVGEAAAPRKVEGNGSGASFISLRLSPSLKSL
jgi:hypothetical protein